jgi:hypothetical protein
MLLLKKRKYIMEKFVSLEILKESDLEMIFKCLLCQNMRLWKLFFKKKISPILVNSTQLLHNKLNSLIFLLSFTMVRIEYFLILFIRLKTIEISKLISRMKWSIKLILNQFWISQKWVQMKLKNYKILKMKQKNLHLSGKKN